MKNFHPHGVTPALVTPFTNDGKKINEASLRKLINFVIDQGVHGIFVSGSQGEAWALSFAERVELMAMAVEITNGRVPVYAGTGCITTAETVALTQEAERCKVDAASIITPFFIVPNQDELYAHYKTIAESADIPVLLYPNPGRTNVMVTPPLLARLAAIPNIVGIKDSSGDLSLSLSYLRATAGTDFNVLVGRDTLIYGALVYGAKGAIAAGANAAPALLAGIYNKFMAGDLAGAMADQMAVEPLRAAFDIGTFPVVIKEVLNMMGFDVGPCRAPVSPLNADQRVKLKTVLSNLPS